ncbi:MAG: Alkaline phosphatase like protein, partial [uncultured Thermomicrobiales bacterium]
GGTGRPPGQPGHRDRRTPRLRRGRAARRPRERLPTDPLRTDPAAGRIPLRAGHVPATGDGPRRDDGLRRRRTGALRRRRAAGRGQGASGGPALRAVAHPRRAGPRFSRQLVRPPRRQGRLPRSAGAADPLAGVDPRRVPADAGLPVRALHGRRERALEQRADRGRLGARRPVARRRAVRVDPAVRGGGGDRGRPVLVCGPPTRPPARWPRL